jgi:hypothetical protein
MRAVDSIRHIARARRDRQPDSSIQQTHELVGLQIDRRVVIEVQRAAVGKKNLHTTDARPHPVAREQRHIRRRIFYAPVPF